jgi:hypothetical protein
MANAALRQISARFQRFYLDPVTRWQQHKKRSGPELPFIALTVFQYQVFWSWPVIVPGQGGFTIYTIVSM